jgi:hypothetical protein
MLLAGRSEVRLSLETLSNRELQHEIATIKQEMAEPADEGDFSETLAKVLSSLGLRPDDLTDQERAELTSRLAEVNRRIELEDLAYQEKLPEQRRASGVKALVDEVLRKP